MIDCPSQRNSHKSGDILLEGGRKEISETELKNWGVVRVVTKITGRMVFVFSGPVCLLPPPSRNLILNGPAIRVPYVSLCETVLRGEKMSA